MNPLGTPSELSDWAVQAGRLFRDEPRDEPLFIHDEMHMGRILASFLVFCPAHFRYYCGLHGRAERVDHVRANPYIEMTVDSNKAIWFRPSRLRADYIQNKPNDSFLLLDLIPLIPFAGENVSNDQVFFEQCKRTKAGELVADSTFTGKERTKSGARYNGGRILFYAPGSCLDRYFRGEKVFDRDFQPGWIRARIEEGNLISANP